MWGHMEKVGEHAVSDQSHACSVRKCVPSEIPTPLPRDDEDGDVNVETPSSLQVFNAETAVFMIYSSIL